MSAKRPHRRRWRAQSCRWNASCPTARCTPSLGTCCWAGRRWRSRPTRFVGGGMTTAPCCHWSLLHGNHQDLLSEGETLALSPPWGAPGVQLPKHLVLAKASFKSSGSMQLSYAVSALTLVACTTAEPEHGSAAFREHSQGRDACARRAGAAAWRLQRIRAWVEGVAVP